MKVEACFTLLSCTLPKKERCVPRKRWHLSPRQGTTPALSQHAVNPPPFAHQGLSPVYHFKTPQLKKAFKIMPLNLCDFNGQLSMHGSALPGREADALTVSSHGISPTTALTAPMPSAVLEAPSTSPRVAEGAWLSICITPRSGRWAGGRELCQIAISKRQLWTSEGSPRQGRQGG